LRLYSIPRQHPHLGTPDPGAVSQIKTCALTADKVAGMATKGFALSQNRRSDLSDPVVELGDQEVDPPSGTDL